MNPFWEVFSVVCLKSLLQSSLHLDSSLKGEEGSHRCPPGCHSSFWCHSVSRPLLVFISLSSSEFQNCFYVLKQLKSKNNPIVKPSRLDIWKDFQTAQERSPEEEADLG